MVGVAFICCTFVAKIKCHQTSQTFNTELDKIFCWLSANKLTLNANKTKFMIFHNPRKKSKLPLFR